MSFSKKIKAKFKDAVKFINDFENTAAELAIDKGYHYVICGHIHQPELKEIAFNSGKVTYLNSGDWVENLTALEYHKGEWELYKYNAKEFACNPPQENDLHDVEDLKSKLNVRLLLAQFKEEAL